MRWVFRFMVLGTIAWCGWWYIAASGLRGATEDWFDLRRAEGWQADHAGIDVSGFPTGIELMLRNPALADPETGVAFEASGLRLTTPALWPGDAMIHFPQDRILVASPDGRASLTVKDGQARMVLHPGSNLEMDTLGFNTAAWVLEDTDGTILSAEQTRLSMVQDAQDPGRYDVTADVIGLAPGAVQRVRLQIPPDWPGTFERFSLAMRVQFDGPWSMAAVEEKRPQPQQINLDAAEIVWGRILLRATADLGIDASGMPSGTVSVQARNWRSMLDLTVAAGLLPAGIRPQVESVLAALANASGNPESFDVTLTLRDGMIRLGFLPIAPAPRLILR